MIQPVHVIVRAVQMAAAIKIPLITNVARTASKKIAVERKDDVGFIDATDRVEIPAKRQLRAFARTI